MLHKKLLAAAVFLASGGFFGPSHAIQYTDIRAQEGSGISSYQRRPSATESLMQGFRDQGSIEDFTVFLDMPLLSRGAPSLVILDHDKDGDEDVFVTNNGANSLYSNQFLETGDVRFVDVASQAGVAGDQDSTGACTGDVDNDGDADLYVMGRMEENAFYLNQGDGIFVDATAFAGLGAGNLGHTSCSFGDIDNDGYLDVVVGNSFDWASQEAIAQPFGFSHPNQLFRNNGDGSFSDVSNRIATHAGFPPGLENAAGVTWGIAMVDYDQDGDMDIVTADDQGLTPSAADGGVDRGFLHLFRNNGDGAFTDVLTEAGLDHEGAWTGMSFADYNCDGHLDMFATNNGDWLPILAGFAGATDFNSRWYLGDGAGGFLDPGVGALLHTPFGWSSSSVDYDNDGQTDILYVGGLDPAIIIDRSNPGTILRNEGCGVFSFDPVLADSHLRRSDQAIATADLNEDGFPDLVTVSNIDIPEPLPIVPWPFDLGSPFDPYNGFVPGWSPNELGGYDFSGLSFPSGTLMVELSSGNSNRWIKVEVMGAHGLLSGAKANRGGIGAVVRFTPRGGVPATRPVSGGFGHSSQDSSRLSFGLGTAYRGDLEVLWPGGVRNRLYNVWHGEGVFFPEIPCPIESPWGPYLECVTHSLADLEQLGELSPLEVLRFLASAIRFRSEV